MKYLKTFLLLISMAWLLMASCAKDPQINLNVNPSLTFSKLSVKIGEPLHVTTTGHTSGKVQWTTGSNGQVWSSGNDTATLLFTSPGTYNVKALFISSSGMSAYDSASGTITVVDSIFSDTSTVHCNVIMQMNLLPDDQVSLTPISFSDTGLIFIAHTQDSYSHSPVLNCGGNLPPSGSVLECDFNSTLLFPCLGSTLPSPAVGIVSFTSLTNGTFSLVFKLNGTAYQGSVTVTSTACNITWSNTSGVTISPLTIQKQ
jgi:hypothetical protein